jgi:hypothetical protein
MPVVNSVARIAVKPLPRMISPKAHAIFDYAVLGTFIGAGSWFWRRNKRAAIAALICAGTELAVCLLTDYPGGMKKVIHFANREEIDLGLAAMTATMPEFLAFDDEPERRFFIAQGALISAATELTRFPQRPDRAERTSRSQHAA